MRCGNTPIRDSSVSTSAVREEFVKRLVGLLAPHANDEIPLEEFPPGVNEPHRAECLQRIATESRNFEELASGSQQAGTDVGLEVVFEDGSCSDLESARNRVEDWLCKLNPSLGWRSPSDVLANGDEAEREYLFGLIAGIECGMHS